MSIRQDWDIRARHLLEQNSGKAERLKEATKFARLLGYKRISWKTLEKLGYNIEALGYRKL